MFKILLGNALFAGCIAAWYFYAGGDHALVVAGTILAFGCFMSGIFMGYLLRGPGKKRRRVVSGASSRLFDAQPDFSDESQDDEAEAALEEEFPEVDAAIESQHEAELEIPDPVPAPVPEPVEIKTFEELVPVLPPTPAMTLSRPPVSPPLVEIHPPAAKVVLDSDGCYEMVAPNASAPFVPDESDIIKRPEEIGKSSPPKAPAEPSEFIL